MAWKPQSMPDILEPGTNEFELVEFWMYDEKEDGSVYNYIFGVNVAKVKEVVWLPEIIKVPNLPEAIVGVINLRGQVIPLIDLAKWMKIREPSDLKRKSVIITEFYKVKIGFIVHEAKRIRRVTWDKIKPPPEVLVAQFGTKVTGVIEIERGNFLLILDLENVLAELGLITIEKEIEVEKVPEDIKGPVLIADDSSVARKILKDIYTKAGFDELIVVKDGEEALNTLLAFLEKAQSEGRDILDYISLVVTDVEMPRMDGYTLARKIKENPDLAKIPVIINTSLSEESNIERAEKVKADAFFVKFEPEELIKVSKELIHRARSGKLGGPTLTNIPTESEVGTHISKMETSANPQKKNLVPKKEPDETISSEEVSSGKQEESTPAQDEEPEQTDDLETVENNTAGEEEMAEEAKNNVNPADEIDALLKELGVETEESKEEKQEETAPIDEQESKEAPADEIDALLAEINGASESQDQQEEEEPQAEVREEPQEEVLPQPEIADDIDALIANFQQQQEAQQDSEDETVTTDETGESEPDIVDQILAELESGKMGAESATNEEGAYEVPTAEKLMERDDVADIIKKLEERLESLGEEDESLKVELIALIESLKAQLEAQKKEKEEKRVIAKLYKVTRETEEETVKLMEILEQAMDKATECMGIVEEVENEEVKAKINEKLNEINDLLFSAINHLQFQDITRQKIERVIVALKKLNDYLNEWFGTDFIGD